MTPDALFGLANLLAIVSWLLLAVGFRRPWVTAVVTGTAVPMLFAVAYVAIIAVVFGRVEGGFSSLDDVARLFGDRWMLLAGWLHYLAFDLLIGTWEARDAAARDVPAWLLVPCFFLTFMFGPAGWLTYMAVRTAYSRPRASASVRAV
jgi:hypothetical protein